MATYTGVDGVVKVNISGGTSTAIAELKGWSIDETGETIDATLLTSAAKIFKAGTKGWTGSADCFWSAEDTTGQNVMTSAAEVDLVFMPEGIASTDITYTGTALVDSISRSAGVDGMVEASFSFTGTGLLVKGAVA